MKKNILLLLAGVTAVSVGAQNFCATSQAQKTWFNHHPELEQQFFAKRAEASLNQQNAKKQSSNQQYIIPIVFHVLHKGTTGEISDAQVLDALRILNNDFNKQNADTTELVPAFQGKAANVGITFQLAKVDPYGTCINGIVHHEWISATFTGDKSDYFYQYPRENYLNVFVVPAISPELGEGAFTYMPGSGVPDYMDAVVIVNSYLGSTGTSNEYKSRTLTHQVAHWLGLEHIWGWKAPGVACGDDNIYDTPETKGFINCNLGNTSVCNPPIVENVQNFMDNALCSRMFTQGQADWINGIINQGIDDREKLWTVSNHFKTGLFHPENHCKTDLRISPFPYMTSCIGNTITITSYTSVAPPSGFDWSANNGALVLSQGSYSTSVVVTNTGITTLKCEAINPSGKTIKTVAIGGVPQQAIATSYSEGFDKGIPSNWVVYGDKSGLWKGNGWSAFLEGDKLQTGSIHVLETPGYDLSHSGNYSFTYKYLYWRTNAYHQDVFKVQGSSDCGVTWTDVHTPYTGAMSAESNGWTTVDVGSMQKFKAFLGQPNVRFRFWFREDSVVGQGTDFSIDDVNFIAPKIVSTVGLDENASDRSLKIFPQPSKGDFFVHFNSDGGSCNYAIMSIDGKVLSEKNLGVMTSGEQELKIENKLAPGIYLLRFNNEGKVITEKLLVE